MLQSRYQLDRFHLNEFFINKPHYKRYFGFFMGCGVAQWFQITLHNDCSYYRSKVIAISSQIQHWTKFHRRIITFDQFYD